MASAACCMVLNPLHLWLNILCCVFVQLVSAPDMPVAQAAPVQAMPAMAEAVGGGGGAATPGIDEDLQVRVASS